MSSPDILMVALHRMWAESARVAEEVDAEPAVRFLSCEAEEFWRGPKGNAKARRRWRRRNIPNSQREEGQ